MNQIIYIDDDMDDLVIVELPEREALSLVSANVAAPINLAAALNVLSDQSTALAGAAQTAPITQAT